MPSYAEMVREEPALDFRRPSRYNREYGISTAGIGFPQGVPPVIILIRKRHVAYVVLLCCFVAGLSAVLWHGNAAFTAAVRPGGGGAQITRGWWTRPRRGGRRRCGGGRHGGERPEPRHRPAGRTCCALWGAPTVTREGISPFTTRSRNPAGEEGLGPPQPGGAGEWDARTPCLLSIHQNSLPSDRPPPAGPRCSTTAGRGAEEVACRHAGVPEPSGQRPTGTKACRGPSSVYLMKEVTAPGGAGGVRISIQPRGDGALNDPAYQRSWRRPSWRRLNSEREKIRGPQQ